MKNEVLDPTLFNSWSSTLQCNETKLTMGIEEIRK